MGFFRGTLFSPGVLIFPRSTHFSHIHVLKQRLSVPVRTALCYGSNEHPQSVLSKQRTYQKFFYLIFFLFVFA